MTRNVDVAVVGGGILGLAHAWAAAGHGLSVVVFERDEQAQGASIRNFGMIWPIGQPAGELHLRALRSRARWLELAESSGIWVNPCGSLHLASQPDELRVLEEFAARAPAAGFECRLLTPSQALDRCPALMRDNLLATLWSPTELCIDPRQAIARIPRFLAELHGVEVRLGTAVTHVEMPRLRTAAGEEWRAGRVVICGGTDFRTLFPDLFATSGIRRCKLQMLRTGPQPGGWRLGPHVAGGLTLCHYLAFQDCPGLPALQKRIQAELPEYVRYGIHVMASQNHLGEVVIGDSHEYDDAIDIFDKEEIDRLILDYLHRMIVLPQTAVVSRWHGVYAKHPARPLFVAEPQPRCHVVTAPGGTGMTMSFGWADDLWEQWA